MFPAVQCAIRDPRLRGLPLQVYLYLLPGLDLQRWTPVKRLEIQKALKLRKERVREALRTLVDVGYLEKGPQLETQTFTYRLSWACPVGSQTVPPQAS